MQGIVQITSVPKIQRKYVWSGHANNRNISHITETLIFWAFPIPLPPKIMTPPPPTWSIWWERDIDREKGGKGEGGWLRYVSLHAPWPLEGAQGKGWREFRREGILSQQVEVHTKSMESTTVLEDSWVWLSCQTFATCRVWTIRKKILVSNELIANFTNEEASFHSKIISFEKMEAQCLNWTCSVKKWGLAHHRTLWYPDDTWRFYTKYRIQGNVFTSNFDSRLWFKLSEDSLPLLVKVTLLEYFSKMACEKQS